MTLLKEAFNFFRRERVWTLLLLFLVVVYAVISSTPARKTPPSPSKTLQKFERSEAKLKDQLRASGNIRQFLSARPALLWTFNLFTFLLVLALLVGLVFDILWLTRPAWRKRFQPSTGPPQVPSWGLGTILKTILLFILLSLSLSILIALLKSIFFEQSRTPLVLLIHTFLSDLLCIGIAIYFIRRNGGDWRDLGLRGSQLLKNLGLGLLGYLAILPVFLFVLLLLVVVAGLFSYEPPPHPLVEVFLEGEHSPGLIAYSLFLACVAGPFFEEIFFRGFFYPVFKKRWGVGWALVLSAGFFALIHQNLFAFFPIFVLGIGLGYLYEKTGTLVPSMALHILHNSIFIAYFFLAKEVLSGVL